MGITMRITFTSPVCSAWGHIVFIDSQAQQPPSSSPLSAANLISAVPLYGSTTRIGSFNAAWTALATSDAEPPAPTPPSLTGCFAANHWSMLVMPLALVNTQTGLSIEGAPINSNPLPSKLAPFAPIICCRIKPPMLLPSVRPSGLACRYM